LRLSWLLSALVGGFIAAAIAAGFGFSSWPARAARWTRITSRFLKNTVSEKLGIGQPRLCALQRRLYPLDGYRPARAGLIEHRETVDIIGDVKVWLRDLGEAWSKEAEGARVEVTRQDAYAIFEFDIAAPRTGEMVALGRNRRKLKHGT
jgi:hypothetical protein